MNIDGLREVIIKEFNKWDELHKLSQDDSEFFNKRLHSFRMEFEPYIYNILINRYAGFLEEHWQNYYPPKQSDNAFVVIERRCHPNYWFVLRNIAWANPNMSVYIICSDENEQFIKALLGDKVSYFHILPLFKGSPNREKAIAEYNNLLTDYHFYEHFSAKYILTIQMDVFIRKKLTNDIFIGDYWGAPWGWKPMLPGGSGSTIRNVKRLQELCKINRPNPLHDNGVNAEDAWFSEKIVESNWNYPDINFRKSTIMESIPTSDPYIIHQFWTYFDSFRPKMYSDLFTNFLNHILTFDI